MSEHLIDDEPRPARQRWRGSRALVHVPLHACPSCGSAYRAEEVAQPALVRHGGYGGTTRTTTLRCPCGWSLVSQVHEVRPDRRESR